jgi:putative endonuclease
MSTKKTGTEGEQIAKKFLLEKGYTILFENWRHKRSEIDIIANIDDICVFVEVKTRKNNHYGTPETFVDDKKMEKMNEAAEAFLLLFPHFKELRFDIISVTNNSKNAPEVTHFIDAFYFY